MKKKRNRMIEYSLYSKCTSIYIGIGIYKNLQMLQAPINDVKEMKNCLERLGFDKSDNNENVLLNEKATKNSIEELINKIGDKLKGRDEEEKEMNKESMFLFYFSGHGAKNTDGNQDVYHLCPHDYDQKKFATSINIDSLVHLVQSFNCKHIVFVLDCCFGGGIFK